MGKRIFLFPGQGSQAIGMGTQLATESPEATEVLGRADEILGFPLSTLMAEGPDTELAATRNTQPALFTVSAMVHAVLAHKECLPDYVAGHSLGEYSALCAAGVFSFEDGLRIVRLRGELMAAADEKAPGAMSAIVGLAREKLEPVVEALDGDLRVVAANYNAPNQVVISGHKEAVLLAGEKLQAAGAKKVVPLKVGGAFHSPLMEFAVPTFQARLSQIVFNPPRVPLLANVTSEPETDPDRIKDLLVKQLYSPVRWVETIQRAVALGCDQGLEVGSGKVLFGLCRSIDRSLKVTPVEGMESIEKAVQS